MTEQSINVGQVGLGALGGIIRIPLHDSFGRDHAVRATGPTILRAAQLHVIETDWRSIVRVPRVVFLLDNEPDDRGGNGRHVDDAHFVWAVDRRVQRSS
eukprot:5731366-Prymnesium_polylepis.1